jgi:hypothetical protein
MFHAFAVLRIIAVVAGVCIFDLRVSENSSNWVALLGCVANASRFLFKGIVPE